MTVKARDASDSASFDRLLPSGGKHLSPNEFGAKLMWGLAEQQTAPGLQRWEVIGLQRFAAFGKAFQLPAQARDLEQPRLQAPELQADSHPFAASQSHILFHSLRNADPVSRTVLQHLGAGDPRF